MKTQLTVAALIWLAAMGASQVRAGAQAGAAGKSIADGVFTAEQAKRGQAVYNQECSTCHLEDMSGGGDGIAPSLAGKAFVDAWAGKPLAELYVKMEEMPPGMADAVTAEQRADVLAYVLSYNKFPAGAAALSHDAAALKQITFVAPKGR